MPIPEGLWDTSVKKEQENLKMLIRMELGFPAKFPMNSEGNPNILSYWAHLWGVCLCVMTFNTKHT